MVFGVRSEFAHEAIKCNLGCKGGLVAGFHGSDDSVATAVIECHYSEKASNEMLWVLWCSLPGFFPPDAVSKQQKRTSNFLLPAVSSRFRRVNEMKKVLMVGLFGCEDKATNRNETPQKGEKTSRPR